MAWYLTSLRSQYCVHQVIVRKIVNCRLLCPFSTSLGDFVLGAQGRRSCGFMNRTLFSANLFVFCIEFLHCITGRWSPETSGESAFLKFHLRCGYGNGTFYCRREPISSCTVLLLCQNYPRLLELFGADFRGHFQIHLTYFWTLVQLQLAFAPSYFKVHLCISPHLTRGHTLASSRERRTCSYPVPNIFDMGPVGFGIVPKYCEK